MRTRTSLPALLLTLALVAGSVATPSALAAKKPKPKSSGPHVKILGFTTYPRLAGVQPQVKPGKTLTQCYDGYNGQREVNVVWRGKGIAKGTKVGVALWGPPGNVFAPSEPTDADVAKTAGKWKYKVSQTHVSAYGFTFAGGPYGPQRIDGTWTAKVVVKGKALARGSVTIACA